MLIDSFQRHITYLRLSVTDRCNLRCRYCMPEVGVSKIEHDDVLTFEEFLRVVQAAASEGMTKIRLTGGEPLVRKGILEFIREVTAIPGTLDLRMTTNGVLLEEMAADLLAAGVKRINMSLDTLQREKFQYITQRDYFDRVWRGLNKALEVGFDRVKLNVVAIRGVNDDEFVDLARLTMDMPIEVRFIEFMPLGLMDYWSKDRSISVAEIKERIGSLGELTPLERDWRDGPARVFRFSGAAGRVGFISAVTDHFCATCNRLRLTADGKLRPCLLSRQEIDIMPDLRAGATREELVEILRLAVKSKPGRHLLAQNQRVVSSGRSMNRIGG